MTQRSLSAQWWLRFGIMLLGAVWVGSILALIVYAHEHEALLAWAGAAILAAALAATLSVAVDNQMDSHDHSTHAPPIRVPDQKEKQT